MGRRATAGPPEDLDPEARRRWISQARQRRYRHRRIAAEIAATPDPERIPRLRRHIETEALAQQVRDALVREAEAAKLPPATLAGERAANATWQLTRIIERACERLDTRSVDACLIAVLELAEREGMTTGALTALRRLLRRHGWR
jgi:hypothetical protein